MVHHSGVQADMVLEKELKVLPLDLWATENGLSVILSKQRRLLGEAVASFLAA